MIIGYVFPGQGDQYINMFDQFFELELLNKEFDLISSSLGEDVKHIGKWANGKSIFKNETAQILMVGYSIILKKIFLDMDFFNHSLCIGYSVGEISANLFANTISNEEALSIAVNRSRIMDMSIRSNEDQGLLSIRGMSLTDIGGLVDRTGNYISIINGEDHILVGGLLRNLGFLESYLIKKESVKTTKLNVNIASHTPLLNKSEVLLYDYLDTVDWRKREIDILSGLDGRLVLNKKDFKHKFSKQISNSINWIDCMNRVREQGIDLLIEIGPGKSITNIIVNNNLGLRVRSINDFKSLEGFVKYIRGVFNS